MVSPNPGTNFRQNRLNKRKRSIAHAIIGRIIAKRFANNEARHNRGFQLNIASIPRQFNQLARRTHKRKQRFTNRTSNSKTFPGYQLEQRTFAARKRYVCSRDVMRDPGERRAQHPSGVALVARPAPSRRRREKSKMLRRLHAFKLNKRDASAFEPYREALSCARVTAQPCDGSSSA